MYFQLTAPHRSNAAGSNKRNLFSALADEWLANEGRLRAVDVARDVSSGGPIVYLKTDRDNDD